MNSELREYSNSEMKALELEYNLGEAEYDRIIAASENRRSKVCKWALGSVACAAAVLILALRFIPGSTDTVNGLELATLVKETALFQMEDVESLTARPMGRHLMVTASMNDGTECSYIINFK